MNFLKTVIAGTFLIATTLTATAGSSIPELFETTVKITDFKGGSGSGTVVYSQETKRGILMYVLTNQHVVDGAIDERLIVTRYGTSMDYQDAIIVATDYSKDLALLRVTNRKHKAPYAWPAVTINEEPVIPGAPVIAVGFPNGQGPLVTDGYASRVTWWNDGYLKKLLTSAPVFYGNSGGGLYTEGDNGYEYVGTIHALGIKYLDVFETQMAMGKPIGTLASPVTHMSYAITVEDLRTFLTNNHYEWIIE